MTPRVRLVALISIGVIAASPTLAADDLCRRLNAFLGSVEPNETHILKFHTSWGGNFKDDNEEAMAAKRCDHGGYAPAKAVCNYLMESGAIEFSGNNAKAVLACLSAKTRFPAGMQLHSISFSMHFGNESRGSLVEVTFQEDDELGGMVLTVSAEGY